MTNAPDPNRVLTNCVEDLLKQGVRPLAIVNAMININTGLIREAQKRDIDNEPPT